MYMACQTSYYIWSPIYFLFCLLPFPISIFVSLYICLLCLCLCVIIALSLYLSLSISLFLSLRDYLCLFFSFPSSLSASFSLFSTCFFVSYLCISSIIFICIYIIYLSLSYSHTLLCWNFQFSRHKSSG